MGQVIENNKEDSSAIRSIYTAVLNNTWEKDIKTLTKTLNVTIAKKIKVWRVDEGQSWRSIAKTFVEKYPDAATLLNIVSENQISGMQLCDAAMKKLKETTDQGWN